MTHEDIIRMARGQGLPETEVEGVFRVNVDDLGRMLAAEREACADILDRNCDKCDPHSIAYEVLDSNAKAIRARGQQ